MPFVKDQIPWNKGKPHLRGKKHWNWQGGIDKEHVRIKQTQEYKDWQQAVYKRDRWTCQKCGSKKLIVAHHIKLFSQFPAEELNPQNLITLCESGKLGVTCHRFFGHLGNYRQPNPDVVMDSKVWNEKLKLRP